MRVTRWLASATVLSALAAVPAAAQGGRLFDNSWFWGAKGGVLSFSTTTVENAIAPSVGVEWLITRQRAGLYLAFDQSFFNETSAIQDQLGGLHQVNIRDMRRVTVALTAFPIVWRRTLRPYAMLGFAMNLIQRAELPANEFAGDQASRNEAQNVIEDRQDRASLVVTGGLQADIRRFSVFGQATAQPSQVGFLLNDRAAFLLEGGIRYNIGSSIERPK